MCLLVLDAKALGQAWHDRVSRARLVSNGLNGGGKFFNVGLERNGMGGE